MMVELVASRCAVLDHVVPYCIMLDFAGQILTLLGDMV